MSARDHRAGSRRDATAVRWALVAAAVTTLGGVLPRDAWSMQEGMFDLSSLAMDQPAMATLLEKTLFKVDVAWLEIWFTPEVDGRIRALAARTGGVDRDSIAAVATRANDVLARLHFRRNVSLGQFLNGLQESARRARDAGIISSATYEDIVSSSPEWYSFLQERGIQDGDEMLYRIRGDTLRTVLRAVDGEVLLDQRDVGAERRLSVLGGYLAPGSDFRRGLIDSAVREATAGGGRVRGG